MITTADLRPMTIGEVLDRSFQVLRHHLGTLFLTALVGALPLLGLYLSASPYSGMATPQMSAGAASVAGIFYLLLLVTMALSWGALTREVDQAVQNEPVSFADGWKQGLRAFFRIIGFGIVAYLAAAAIFIVPLGIFAAIALPLIGTGTASVATTVAVFGIGLVVMFGGLIYWAPIGFMGLPAIIIERLGPIKALRRAHGLGKGGRIRVAVTALVAWIIMILPTFGLSFVLGLGAAAVDPTAVGTTSATQVYLYQAISFLVTGVTTPFMVAAMVFTYYDRRVRREGYDVELSPESSSPQPV